MKSIAVAVNVKNEAAVIARCLGSVAEWASAICVIDTGSTDGTLDVVRSACEPLGFGDKWGNLFLDERPWVSFAANQSALLELSREWSRCEYTWILDADEVVVGRPDLRGSPDSYSTNRIHAGDWENWCTRIFSNAKPWRYEGERHAYPALQQTRSMAYLSGCRVENHRDNANGKATREEQVARFERDVEHFAAKLKADPRDTRSAYYLAQSFHDAGQAENALAAYQRRANMIGQGNELETQVAMLQVARYLRRFREPADSVVTAYQRAIAHDPGRLCGLVELMQFHNDRGEFGAALFWAHRARGVKYEPGQFLARISHRTWRRQFEEWRAYRGVGLSGVAECAAEDLLGNPHLPAPERRYIEQASAAAA